MARHDDADYAQTAAIIAAMSKVPNVHIDTESGQVLGSSGTSITGETLYENNGSKIKPTQPMSVGKLADEDDYMRDLVARIKQGHKNG